MILCDGLAFGGIAAAAAQDGDFPDLNSLTSLKMFSRPHFPDNFHPIVLR